MAQYILHDANCLKYAMFCVLPLTHKHASAITDRQLAQPLHEACLTDE